MKSSKGNGRGGSAREQQRLAIYTQEILCSAEEAIADLKVSLADAPVVALHSEAVLPNDSENALKESMDRKNKIASGSCDNVAHNYALVVLSYFM